MVKKSVQKKLRIEKFSKNDRFLVIVKDVREEIKLVAEGNAILQKRMDAGFEGVNGRMDSMGNRMDSVEGKIDLLKQDIDSVKEDLNSVKEDLNSVKEDLVAVKEDLNSVKEEMRMGFKTLIAESVEDEEKFAAKADKKDLILLEKRVEKLETAK